MVDLTYSERKSYEKHKMRIIGSAEKGIVGITLAKDTFSVNVNTWYTATSEDGGRRIILESGCAPSLKK